MAKEWILNSATNRFQLNFKRNVGATSEAIRKCAPKTLEEWQTYYFANVRTEEQIVDLGKKLYVKISEVLVAEIDEITEEDCIAYIKQLVIDRTYDGYVREIKTIYEQLQEIVKEKIEPAPDEWDRLFNVDFFIKINGRYIGLQIKPVSQVSSIPEIYKESADFRFFIRWIEMCFSEIQSKTENLIDLLDPLRCPSDLLWMLSCLTCAYLS